MKKTFLLLTAFLTVFVFSVNAQNKYVENRVVIKLKKNCSQENFLSSLAEKSNKIRFGKIDLRPVFSAQDKALNNILFVKYSEPYNPEFVVSVLSENACVDWAEPDYLGKISGVVPNDEYYSSQWYLQKIEMESAWEMQQGDGEIVVAVIDNGLSVNHPDLSSQIWQNPNETADGVDNDNNGYIDDINGWDFGNNDNGIEHDGTSFHGTQVAGLIGATTNNSVGIASVGYNVKLMGLKITDYTSDTEVIMSAGYQAMIYAADNGASVINCSWGNYNYSHLGEEAVNYAISKNVVVVAAAGNDGINEIFYPARYGNVLAVGATDSSDVVWDASNYGYYVDLMSPGKDIISTGASDGYETASGTSLATPLVSGVAALLKLHFPDISSLAIAQRIRVSASDIYGNNSAAFQDLLGYGRLNAYAALTSSDLKSVRALLTYITDYNDNVFTPGESVDFIAGFINYLSPTSNLEITLQTSDPYITITQNAYAVGAVETSETFSNTSVPFRFTVADGTPENHIAYIKLAYNDGTYSDFQWFEVLLNPTYSDMNVNNLDLTITSKGTLGFEDYPYNSKGNGLTYKNDNKIRFFEAGFLYGNSETQVMDALHISQFSTVSNDFNTVIPFHSQTPGIEADQQGALEFNDDNAGENKLNVSVWLSSFAFSDESNSDYIILKYTLVNNSSTELNNFYAGLYFDWDLDEDDYADDIAAYNADNSFGYAYDSGLNTISTYQGVALISPGNTNFWANANDGTGGGINVEEFTDAEKWTMLSSGLTHTSAGPSDISFVLSGGPYSLAAGDSVAVAFAVAISETLDELSAAITAARNKYFELPSDVNEEPSSPLTFELKQNYPNPFNPTTTIKYTIPQLNGVETHGRVSLRVYNILGEEVATLVNKQQAPGNYTVQFDASNLPSGVYFYTLRVGNFVATKKMILLK